MQSAGVVGIYGLTCLTVIVCAGPGVLAAVDAGSGRSGRRWLVASLPAVVPLAIMTAYGAARLAAPVSPMVDGVTFRLVQPAVPQREKWLHERQQDFFRLHLDLTQRAPDGREDGLAGITHVIWPEAAMPFLPLSRPEAQTAIGRALPDHVHLLAGLTRIDPARPAAGETFKVYNSLVTFDGAGDAIGIYDKIHLVPFGEYLPFQATLESIGLVALTRQRGGFASRPESAPAAGGAGPAAGARPLICYEAVFPAARRAGRRAPARAHQHHQRRLVRRHHGAAPAPAPVARARVEEGLPLMRVANNGISAAYDPYGRRVGPARARRARGHRRRPAAADRAAGLCAPGRSDAAAHMAHRRGYARCLPPLPTHSRNRLRY